MSKHMLDVSKIDDILASLSAGTDVAEGLTQRLSQVIETNGHAGTMQTGAAQAGMKHAGTTHAAAKQAAATHEEPLMRGDDLNEPVLSSPFSNPNKHTQPFASTGPIPVRKSKQPIVEIARVVRFISLLIPLGIAALFFITLAGDALFEKVDELFYSDGQDSIEVMVDDDSVNDDSDASFTDVDTSSSDAAVFADTDSVSTQESALDTARMYVEYGSSSHDGLVDMLEYANFSHEDAVYAADNCGADWNQEAVEMAQSYLETMPMSRSELADQLEFEQFTSDQIAYAIEHCGADWNE